MSNNLVRVLIGISIAMHQAHGSTVTVMVAYDGTALSSPSVIDPAGYALASIERANALFSNSQLTDRFELSYAHPLSVAPPSTMPQAVLDWVRDDTTMKGLRNSNAADLVVIVAGAYGGPAGQCGVAAGIGANFLYKDSRFAVVVKQSCIESLQATTLGHELSHLAGAAHENVAGYRPYGHPWLSTSLQKGTVMMSSDLACGGGCQMIYQLSSPVLKVPGTTVTAGDSVHSNNRKVMDEGMDIMQYYRGGQTVPTVSAPFCHVEFMRCENNFREMFVSWYTTTPAPFADADVDISYNAGGSWSDWYSTAMDQCVPIVPQSPIRIRARMRSGYGDSAYCTVNLSPTPCQPGDDW